MAHTTRSRNTYTDQEWEEKQEEFSTQRSNQIAVEKMKNYAARKMNEQGLNGDYLKDKLLFVDEMLEANRINCDQDTAIWLSELAERFLDKCSELENVDPIG